MRIRIHPTLYAYLIVIAVLSSWQTCIATVASLIIHESGHLLVSCFIGERIKQLELTPFGGLITYREGAAPMKGLRGVLVASSGPLANYLCLLILGLPDVQHAMSFALYKSMLCANLTMLCFNLLPALPLDGGRIVFCIGYCFLSVSKLITMLTMLGILFGISMIALAVWGASVLKLMNCSLVIAGIYMIACAKKSRTHMLAENVYVFVQEYEHQTNCVMPARVYWVSAQAPLLKLIDRLDAGRTCLFVFEDERGIHGLSQRNACRMMMRRIHATVSEAYHEKGL